MLISTRGRYALRFMLELADVLHNPDTDFEKPYITTEELAERQEVSRKYAERIMAVLSRSGLVLTQQGRGGGYRLRYPPSDYNVGEILRVMDEELSPVACLKSEPNECPRAGKCKTLPMWQELGNVISNYFDGITLADLMKK